MIVTPVNHGLQSLIGVSTGYRSPGLHASTIYGSLAQHLYPKRYGQPGGSKSFDMLRMEMGLTFEQALEEAFRGSITAKLQAERPPEQMTTKAPAGVAYSPDLLIFRDTHTALGEIKLSWMSCKDCPITEEQAVDTQVIDTRDPRGDKLLKLKPTWDGVSPASFPSEKFDKWFWQMKFYCYHLGLTHAELYACFVNADNTARPVLLAWAFEFTERELQDNNAMMINHARAEGMLSSEYHHEQGRP